MVGPFINTASGRAFCFWPINLDAICIEDIARSLSNTCRFNGHLPKGVWYSVAEHSVLLANLLANELSDGSLATKINFKQDVLTALLHDAPEAYLSDIPGPLKSGYRGTPEDDQRGLPLMLQQHNGKTPAAAYEEHLWEAIALRFGLQVQVSDQIKRLDKFSMLRYEMVKFDIQGGVEWPQFKEIDKVIQIQQLSPQDAEDLFLQTFEELNK